MTLTTPRFDPKMLFCVEFHLGILPTKFGASRLIVWQVNGKSNMHRPFCQWNWHCACAVSRDLLLGGLWKPHIWNRRPHFAYSHLPYNFYGAMTTIKGRLLLSVPIVKRFSAEYFLSPLFCQNLTFGVHKKGFNVNFNFLNPQKALPCVKTRFLSHRALKSVEGYDL